jgi:citrate lyase subunit beta/citryl-CoA lyase
VTPAQAWRSLLFMPADAERFVASAHRRGADAIILDLEDAIAPAMKAAARSAVAGHADLLAGQGMNVLVRVNAETELRADDIAASVRPSVRALMLPKIGDPAAVVAAARPIAAADPRIVALGFGPEDFSVAMGIVPETAGLAMPAQMVAMAAHAAGHAALGLAGSIASIGDPEKFAAVAAASRTLGFTGSMCIHPAQVALLNAAFGATAAQTQDADDIRVAFETALAAGAGAVQHRGRMIDRPIYLRALAILERGKSSRG